MSFAELGNTVTLLASTNAANGAPSGDVGLVMATAFPTVKRASKYLLKIKITGAGAVSIDAFLWARQRAGGDWSPLGDKDGKLNDGTTITGSVTRVYTIPCEFLSAFERLYLQILNLTGTTAVDATLTEIIE
jgi:hypothetical protein